ncbi:MAG: 50S ribosomal protein L19 [Alphaproteobacteria bacterium]
MNILEKFEKEQLKELQSDKKLPKFSPGDTVKVHLRVREGEKERIQIFEGVCIAIKNAGINSSFTVRKISYGEGIERVLPLFSPQISKVEVAKIGSVKRSKLYYLRQRSGKSARIAEKNLTQNTSNSVLEEKNTNKNIGNLKSSEKNSVVSEKKSIDDKSNQDKELKEVSKDEKK